MGPARYACMHGFQQDGGEGQSLIMKLYSVGSGEDADSPLYEIERIATHVHYLHRDACDCYGYSFFKHAVEHACMVSLRWVSFI